MNRTDQNGSCEVSLFRNQKYLPIPRHCDEWAPMGEARQLVGLMMYAAESLDADQLFMSQERYAEGLRLPLGTVRAYIRKALRASAIKDCGRQRNSKTRRLRRQKTYQLHPDAFSQFAKHDRLPIEFAAIYSKWSHRVILAALFTRGLLDLENDPNECVLHVSKSWLSRWCGLSRPTVIAACSKLEADGVIETDGGHVRIRLDEYGDPIIPSSLIDKTESESHCDTEFEERSKNDRRTKNSDSEGVKIQTLGCKDSDTRGVKNQTLHQDYETYDYETYDYETNDCKTARQLADTRIALDGEAIQREGLIRASQKAHKLGKQLGATNRSDRRQLALISLLHVVGAVADEVLTRSLEFAIGQPAKQPLHLWLRIASLIGDDAFIEALGQLSYDDQALEQLGGLTHISSAKANSRESVFSDAPRAREAEVAAA